MTYSGRLYIKNNNEYEALMSSDYKLETDSDTPVFVACASCEQMKQYAHLSTISSLDLRSYTFVCYDCEIGADFCWKCKKFLEIDGDVSKCSCRNYCVKCKNPEKSKHHHSEESYAHYYHELVNNRIGFFEIPECFRTRRLLYHAMMKDATVIAYHFNIRPDLYTVHNDEPIKIPEKTMKFIEYCFWGFKYAAKTGNFQGFDQKRLTKDDLLQIYIT